MKRKTIVFGSLLVVVAGSLAAASLLMGPRGESAERPTLDEAIASASDYLVRHCEDDGQFIYRVNLNPDVGVLPRYNIVRHAGTIYALAESQRRRPSQKKLDTLRRAVEFMRRETISSVPGKEDLLAVWSHPEINGRDVPLQAKLGGTGLGLVALVSAERVAPGTVPLEELQAMARFLVFMQERDGSFYSKYFPDGRGRDGRWQSLYYPGEAALGLVMLYEIDPQPQWLEAAALAISYLSRRSGRLGEVEPDHWVLLATARLWPIRDKCSPPVPDETLLRHATRICRRMLDDRKQAGGAAGPGCFTPDGRTCPTATRVEGLTAALTFLPESEQALRDEIRETLGPAVDFLLDSQVTEGRHAGGIPRGVRLADKKRAAMTQAERHQDDRRTEIRVDYVQHAISAMIQWEQVSDETSAPEMTGG